MQKYNLYGVCRTTQERQKINSEPLDGKVIIGLLQSTTRAETHKFFKITKQKEPPESCTK